MTFQHLVRYYGLPYWIKRKGWQKSQKAGRCYFNIFRNGRGLGCNFVVLNTRSKDRITFSIPNTLLMDACKELQLRKPAQRGRKTYKWKKQVIVDEHGKILWVKKK